ncbi:DUF4886 domain-containing protein, partial [Steroidobacter sp.]|uniref:DUF4886 domain-containing protein n=1 Tax=Steroidobacter sp. TaxID=1978227 RepID=UPI001A4B93E0
MNLKHCTWAVRLLAGLLLPLCAQSAPAPPPASAIFIGNSFFYYNNGINEHLLKLVRAAQPDSKFRVTLVAISGSGADWHDVESYFRPKALAQYAFDANNTLVFNDLTRLFDVAVLMDCSQCPVHPQLKDVFHTSIKKHSATIRKHGATPVLFMSWAYQDKPEMTQGLADAYTRAGIENDAVVIPAGLAFANAITRSPDLSLYAPDKRHPSLAGTYLAACTAYATLFGTSPVGSSYRAGLDATSAALLQTVAWETVQAYGRTV